jgi:protease I
MNDLRGRRIGILAASGSDQTEMTVIRRVLDESGVTASVVSPKKQELRAWLNVDWGASIAVDLAVIEARPDDFDGLVIPGGLIAADTLRADRQAVDLVRALYSAGKPIAAVGHAPWVLIEAGALRERRATSFPGIRRDIENAGAQWLDAPAVTDGMIVTGRNQHDLPDFMAEFVETVMLG